MTDISINKLSSSGQSHAFLRPSIGQKMGRVFILVLLVATANIVVVKQLLNDLNNVAATLNVTGKLRMLSQRMAFETVSLPLEKEAGSDTVKASIRDFEVALAVLERGGTIFGYEIPQLGVQHHERLQTLRHDWVGYRGYIEAVLAAANGRVYSAPMAAPGRYGSMAQGAATILTDTENLISFVVTDTQHMQQRGLMKIYTLLLLDILVLVVAFVAIRRKIVYPLHDLVWHCDQLAAGNYQVRTKFTSTDELGQLAIAFNHSAQHIGNLLGHIELERQSLERAETMFRQLAENSGVGVYIVKDDKFHFANAKMADMFCYQREEMTSSLSVFDIVVEDQRAAVKENIRRRLAGELQEVHYERRARRKDGSLFDVEVFGSKMKIDDRDVTIGVMLDITRRKQNEMEARLTTLVYQHTSEAIMITDAIGTLVNVNPAFSEITGYLPQEVIGRNISILSSGLQDAAFYQAMWLAIDTEGKWRGEIWNQRKSGELFAERLAINTVFNDNGTVYQRIGLFSDVTDKKQAESLIWEQANLDLLTRLPNRMMFHDRLQQEIEKSRRATLPLALMFLDLDNFKEVNDTLGHEFGDQLLRQAAERLRSCVRSSDTVARLGGDEFTLILGELSDSSVVEHVARKILQVLAQPFLLADEALYVSASIGITFYPEDATEPQDLIRNADQAMYEAKYCGRNQFSYFVRSMRENAQSRRELARDLRLALADDQFCLYYQPIVTLATGSIDKAEALVRWQHPERGLVNPAEFISVAEETGLINALGEWVFRQAARQTALWRASHGAQFQVSVNTSAVQFRHNGIRPAEWLAWLEQIGLPGSSIAIEITESLLMDAGTAVIDTLLAFRDAGIAVSIDDFGTGYSSLSYLKKFNIDYLKIDQSFVRNLKSNSSDLALCEAMIVMAHKLGIKVIAEGVETAQQRDLLAAAGCDYAQGYLFSRPVTAVDFPLHI